MMKAQERTESNVLSKLQSNNSIESRGYVNDRTQQLLKPLTVKDVRGFYFVCFRLRIYIEKSAVPFGTALFDV